MRWNIPAVIVINNNRSLNQEIAVYSKAYGGELEGKHSELWHFPGINFAETARTMGAEGIRVKKPGAFAGALSQALACGKPCVIDVVAEMEAGGATGVYLLVGPSNAGRPPPWPWLPRINSGALFVSTLPGARMRAPGAGGFLNNEVPLGGMVFYK